MARSFAGGIKPEGCKARTSKLAIRDVPSPARVVIPLSQHVGAPAVPVVKPGDKVCVGTKIAEPRGAVSAAVHSSVSGAVRSVGDFALPGGAGLPAIEIESDGRDQALDVGGWQDLSGAPRDTVLEAVREAGIVGLGGGGFPTHVKLAPRPETPVDLVILNGAECEPYLTGDQRVMLEQASQVVDGLKVIMRVVEAERGVIAVERDKGDAAAKLRQAVKSEEGIAVEVLRTKYPQGSEKQLVKAVAGREVPRGNLPVSVGCLVHNVATGAAISVALRRGRPLTDRVVTVAGSAAKGAGNFRVPIGTLLGDLVAYAGGLADDCRKVIVGGPMTGAAQATLDVPVTKTTTGVILLGAADVDDRQAGPCIRCGRCVDRCPMGLMPNELARFAEKGRLELAAGYGIADCIECGVCAYVCPSSIRHVYLIRRGKALLAAGRQAA